MKKVRLSAMAGADILTFFERLYYARVPGGEVRRRIAGAGHVMDGWWAMVRGRHKLLAASFPARSERCR
jgi:hypothetical protein